MWDTEATRRSRDVCIWLGGWQRGLWWRRGAHGRRGQFLSNSGRKSSSCHCVDKSHVGTHVLTAAAFLAKHGMWGPINLKGLLNCKDEAQFLFLCIPSASYPATSFSVKLLFSVEAGRATCRLTWLSGRCGVAVKYRTSQWKVMF